MATIKDRNTVPPGGWRYVDAYTGMRFKTDNWGDLVRAVRKHREYKGNPVDEIEIEIDRQLCAGLSTEWCAAEPGETHTPVIDLTQRLTPEMAASANRAVLSVIRKAASGEPIFNDPAEARARAEVCRKCPFNIPSKDCSCHAVYKMVELMVPEARKQPGVSVCAACGCSLQAKVNLAGEVVRQSLPAGLVLPKWCWQAKFAEPVEGFGER